MFWIEQLVPGGVAVGHTGSARNPEERQRQ